jgi:hypothetical protein
VETLLDVINDPVRGRAVVTDAARLIDAEVAKKGGISGLAIKGGYRALKSLKPTMIEEALAHLLPDFARAVQPDVDKGRAEGNLKAYFAKNGDVVADALLAVTDRKGQNAKNKAIKRIYDGLRPQAKKQVVESLPGLADLIVKHVK